MSSESFIINPAPGRRVVKYFTLNIFAILTFATIVESIWNGTYLKLLYAPFIIAIVTYIIHLVAVDDVLITKVDSGIIELEYGYKLLFKKRVVFNIDDVKSVTFFSGYRAQLIIYRLKDNKKHSRIFHPYLNTWWEKDYKILLDYIEEKDIPVYFYGPAKYDWNGFPTNKSHHIDSERYHWLTPKNIWTGGRFLD